MFKIVFTESALDDLRFLKKAAQRLVLDAIEEQLANEPLTVTRNRKPLRANDLFTWEARVGSQRVFYDVDADKEQVLIKAIGWKEHNTLYIRGKEYKL